MSKTFDALERLEHENSEPVKPVAYRFWYSMVGLGIGAACMLAGVILFLHGIGGSPSWTSLALHLTRDVSDIVAAILFNVAGMFLVWATRLPR